VDITKAALAVRQNAAASKIDDWAAETKPQIKAAADKRVNEILSSGWKEFQDKLREFELRIIDATKKMGALQDTQAALDGKQLLLSKALAAYAAPNPQMVERLSAYIGEALWVIYLTAIALLVLLACNLRILWVMWKKH